MEQLQIIMLTLPILSKRTTSSLLSSHRSRGIGLYKIAPDLLVTGRPLLNWYRMSSLILGNDGPSNLNKP